MSSDSRGLGAWNDVVLCFRRVSSVWHGQWSGTCTLIEHATLDIFVLYIYTYIYTYIYIHTHAAPLVFRLLD